MPGGDGTGPRGMGAMTGRAAGYCAGNSVPGYMNPGPGYGYGVRRGNGPGGMGFGSGFGGRGRGGRGRGFGCYGPGVPGWVHADAGLPRELEALRMQAEQFGGALDGIKKRIEELEAGNQAE